MLPRDFAKATWLGTESTEMPTTWASYRSKKYGVWKDDKGICERSIVIVDKQGIVRYVDVHDISEAPDNAQLLDVLRELD